MGTMAPKEFETEFDAEKTTEKVAARLEQAYPERDEADLQALAKETVDQFTDAPVKDFIDVVAEHEAREQIRKEDSGA
jgi:glutamyl-tRNA reductase